MHQIRSFGLFAVLIVGSVPAWGVTTQLFDPSEFGPSTVIDFDGHAEGTAANTLYAALGIEFSNDGGGSTVPIIDWAALSRTTTSPPNVLSTEDGVNGSVFTDFVDLVFSTSVTEVGAWFGNDQGLAAAFFPVTLTVFDAGDVELGSVTVITNQNVSVDQFIGIRSDPDSIARARIQYDPAVGDLSVVLDDVIFNAVVPEPASGLLLALGLAGLAARRFGLARVESA